MRRRSVRFTGVLGSLRRHVYGACIVLFFLYGAILVYFCVLKWREYDSHQADLASEKVGLLDRERWLKSRPILDPESLIAEQEASNARNRITYEADPLFFHTFFLLDNLILERSWEVSGRAIPASLRILRGAHFRELRKHLESRSFALESLRYRVFTATADRLGVADADRLLAALRIEQNIRIETVDRLLRRDIGVRSAIFLFICLTTAWILVRFRHLFLKHYDDWDKQQHTVISTNERMRFALKLGGLGYFDWSIDSGEFLVESDFAPFIGLSSGRYGIENWYATMLEADRTRVVAQVNAAISERQPLQTEYRTHEGMICGFESDFFKIRSELRCIGVLWNLEPEKKREREIEEIRLLQTETARLASLGEMSSGIAHEINNPLSVIVGKARLLLDQLGSEGAAPDRLQYHLEKLETNASRISEIVRGFHLISRDCSRDEMSRESLNQIIATSLSLCAERARMKSIRLEVDLQKTKEMTILCRPAQISQILLNLVNNAVDACLTTPDPWIRISTDRTNARAILMVEDSGVGVSPDLEERIMKPFFTTKEPGKGTGLGLSISSRIATEHGGVLRLRREQSASCFSLEIPVIPGIESVATVAV